MSRGLIARQEDTTDVDLALEGRRDGPAGGEVVGGVGTRCVAGTNCLASRSGTHRRAPGGLRASLFNTS